MPISVDLCDTAKFSCLNAVERLTVPGRIVILVANLEMLSRTLDRVNDAVTFFDCKRETLFTIDVPATLQCGYHMLRMKREWSGHDYCVKVTRSQKFVITTISGRIFFRNLASSREARLVYIAESGKANSGNAQECSHQLLSAAADPNDAEIDLIGRFSPQVTGLRQKNSTAQRSRCAANEFAPIHLFCSSLLPNNGVASVGVWLSPALFGHCQCTSRWDSISSKIHSPRA